MRPLTWNVPRDPADPQLCTTEPHSACAVHEEGSTEKERKISIGHLKGLPSAVHTLHSHHVLSFPARAAERRSFPKQTFYFPLRFSTLKHSGLVTGGDRIPQREWPGLPRRDTKSRLGANDFVDAFSPRSRRSACQRC
ncbi:hypothetical protein CDAR_495551 [Caerostris darwini]|uniref:Uncharacterized protein n=1 Tax=Caerostris darwini TaxID=1538125 RepID=A0AAV4S7R2_9ARAC|nr:hypothetical protein CDAR_495551 [Caerostris darwini]